MHTEDVLGLGKGRSVGLLEFALFARRVATVAPIADKELRVGVAGNCKQIPIDALRRMRGPGDAGKIEVVEPVRQRETVPLEGS